MRRLAVMISCSLVVGALGAGAAAGSASGAARLPQCQTSQLTARVTGANAGLGHVGFVLVLTNRSSSRCQTGGYVGLLRLDSHHRRVRTVVHRGSGYLWQSPRPRTLVVARGGSVSAGVEWVDVPSPSDSADCDSAGTYLLVTPPNERSYLTIRAPTADCGRGFISTTALQAGSRGPRA
jgi:uncharacterized protein DUF4232